ncbi:hypothetical protein CBR_g8521 [Chara braunii]|uniref:Neutral/alkaline non-lysosomal ceramidase N-terminal domain-containing protein n=1 Tax=Chara braunii TaxID=69332 RepID=A0A388KME1_CHABU|nr:hypothetical protein CBR_g8521 [Chara braunii]|eukprot:GBG71220.1 hypothetical protein CBR_g8521 [Chara braunii]
MATQAAIIIVVVLVVLSLLAVASRLLAARGGWGIRRALPNTGSIYERHLMGNGGEGTSRDNVLMAGAWAVDITPSESVYLAGYAPNRRSEGVSDRLWVRALVLQCSRGSAAGEQCDRDSSTTLSHNQWHATAAKSVFSEADGCGDGSLGRGGAEEEEGGLGGSSEGAAHATVGVQSPLKGVVALRKSGEEAKGEVPRTEKPAAGSYKKGEENHGNRREGEGEERTEAEDDVCSSLPVKTNRVVILAVDCIGIQGDEMDSLKMAIEGMVDAKHAIVASTHTHSGPDTLGLWGKPPFRCGIDRDYMSRVYVAAAEAVQRAIENVKPAELASCRAYVDVPMLTNLRREGMIDQEMNILHVQEAGGGPGICTVMEVACHPELMPSTGRLISSDFPNWVREKVEGEMGGCAIFVAGALGGLVTPSLPPEAAAAAATAAATKGGKGGTTWNPPAHALQEPDGIQKSSDQSIDSHRDRDPHKTVGGCDRDPHKTVGGRDRDPHKTVGGGDRDPHKTVDDGDIDKEDKASNASGCCGQEDADMSSCYQGVPGDIIGGNKEGDRAAAAAAVEMGRTTSPWSSAAAFGNILGDKVVQALRSLEDSEGNPYNRRPELSIWHMPVAVYSSNMNYFLGRLLGLLHRSKFYGSSWIQRLPIWPLGYFVTTVSVLDVGTLCAVTVPGEISPCLSLRIKHTVRTAGLVPRVMLIGLANDELGYILPYDLYDLPLFKYEKKLCCDSRTGTTVLEALADIALRMGQRKELLCRICHQVAS